MYYIYTHYIYIHTIYIHTIYIYTIYVLYIFSLNMYMKIISLYVLVYSMLECMSEYVSG